MPGYHHVPPGEVVWVLARARARERAGDHAGAGLDYARVAKAWRNGDDALQPAVDQARRALARLVTETP